MPLSLRNIALTGLRTIAIAGCISLAAIPVLLFSTRNTASAPIRVSAPASEPVVHHHAMLGAIAQSGDGLFGGAPLSRHHHATRTNAATVSAPDDRAALDQSVKSLLDGTMRYQVPETMTIDEPELVTLRISSTPNDTSIASGFSGTSDTVKFADSIRASLYGGDDFTVTARQTGDPQLIPPTGFTSWQWDVKPVHAGKSRLLTLRLDTYVHIHGRDVFYGTTKETNITVKVNAARQLTDFAKDHLEWLWGLCVIPAAEFLRRRFTHTASSAPEATRVQVMSETVEAVDVVAGTLSKS